MKKLLTLLLTIVMAVCLVHLNNSHTKAEENSSSIPFTITATENDTKVKLWKFQSYTTPVLQYSKNGSAYVDYSYSTDINLNKNDTVQFKTTTDCPLSKSNSEYVKLIADKKITVSGNIMSLVSTTFSGVGGNVIPGNRCFYRLFFECENLTSIEGLELPAKTLKNSCYEEMFNGCAGLTSIPEKLLPATGLAWGCYKSMFSDCTGLTSIPEKLLPATTLGSSCYCYMFSGCTGLTYIPEKLLPATTLESFCYNSMFSGCSEITNIPNLPATTLADDCYEEMFYDCVKLPEGMSETPTAVLTEKFSIPTSGTIDTHGDDETTNMFGEITGLTATPDLSSGSKDYYRKATPIPEPEHKFECEGTTCKTTITDDEIIDQTAHCENVNFDTLKSGTTKVEKVGTSTTTLIKDTDYSLSKGSVNVTLKKDYLKTLGVGTHKFKATLDDGTVHYFDIVISIEKAGEPSKPVVKDESCEKVIGPTWHWNNTKGICEDYGVVGTSTR